MKQLGCWLLHRSFVLFGVRGMHWKVTLYWEDYHRSPCCINMAGLKTQCFLVQEHSI